MKLLALFALFVVAASKHVLFDPDLDNHWQNFKRVFNKSYDAREDAARRVIWEQRVADVFQHNIEADLGSHSYKKGLNQYSDIEHREFVSHFNGFRLQEQRLRSNSSTWLPPKNIQLPEKVDWRDEGLVTEVKNQLNCGSCWSFAATGTLEGQQKRKSGRLVSLSEQNLIDCSKPQGNKGCNGGIMDAAFDYIKSNDGIDTEESYPYTAKDEFTCRFQRSSVGATCTGYVNLPVGDEEALQQAVATVGPISVAIDASHEGFQSYKSGVYDDFACSSEDLDHGVLVVGYGTENGRDYWLVKNSWGTSWGDHGYIKMTRNKNNQCGIATHALYPLV